MKGHRMAVVGIGATGSVLAAALLSKYPETFLIGRKPDLGIRSSEVGLNISGAITYRVAVKNYSTNLGALRDFNPSIIFLATKTFHLAKILEDLKAVFKPGIKIISTQNGLGTEDLIGEKFGKESAFRMSLNYGVALKSPSEAQVAFFNKPNYLGCLAKRNQQAGKQIAKLLTDCGLDTKFVDDIKLFVWKKMIMKCTLASICAVTDKSIKDALEYPPTREIADACFKEALAVAKAMGYDVGKEYLKQALAYLERVGVHKDSMCVDIANQTPTEIDFLGAKIVEYARANGISTPFYVTMTNLVKAIEDHYLDR
jgi:2-dehydropantoate 2-reductase